MVVEGPVGLEPTTPCLKGRCSNRLSYGPELDLNFNWKSTPCCYRLEHEVLLLLLQQAAPAELWTSEIVDNFGLQ